jgi:tellurite resistance protein TerC
MMLIDVVKIPVVVSLGVVVAILVVTMVASVKTAPKIGHKTAARTEG